MLFAHEYSRICCLAEQDGKRRRRKKRQLEKRTPCASANGFLKYSFTPVVNREVGLLGQAKQVQQEFFHSLANLAEFYQLNIACEDNVCYPLNIKEAFEKAKKAFDKKPTGLHLIIAKDKTRKACISTVKTYDTGQCLFYLPVKPLLLLMQIRRMKKEANLLLSVFAYLYQVGGVPYFTQGFLAGEYDMIYEWYTTDESEYDEEYYNAVIQAYKQMNYFGKKLFKSISHKYHLQQFENRVQQFKPANQKDTALHEVSLQLLAVYKQYPERSIMDNIHECTIEQEGEEKVLPDQYISFFWDAEGIVYDQLIETVNTRFQETIDIDEPAAVQYFDRLPEKEQHDLGFEEQFFDSLHNLSDVLNDL